jgi:Glu-tRNA(Gln) amidotransferase subunit E-like FAD-binding protein
MIDGSTEFERILPGPDRMYPDTDSQPTELTRERVERLRKLLPALPWDREARYSEVGVPRNTIHYLIRRGGAAKVDRVVERSGGELRQVCFFFGERLKGLRRAGVAVDDISDDRWCELFSLMQERPVLWQAWTSLVRQMSTRPDWPVEQLAKAHDLGTEPKGWREMLPDVLRVLRARAYDPADPERLARYALGRVMRDWRGRVDARAVSAALREELAI